MVPKLCIFPHGLHALLHKYSTGVKYNKIQYVNMIILKKLGYRQDSIYQAKYNYI